MAEEIEAAQVATGNTVASAGAEETRAAETAAVSMAAANTADPAVAVAVVPAEALVAQMEVKSATPVAEMVAEVMVALVVEEAAGGGVGLGPAGASLVKATEEASKAAAVSLEARRVLAAFLAGWPGERVAVQPMSLSSQAAFRLMGKDALRIHPTCVAVSPQDSRRSRSERATGLRVRPHST